MKRRVLMVGWDGADAAVVERLARAGRLPVLDALRRRGASGALAGLPGLGDDACWASFATGLGPGIHGRFHHEQPKPGSYRQEHFHRGLMTHPPFWSRLSDAGCRIAVVDVPKSPLAESPNGVELTDWMPHGEDWGAPAIRPGSRALPRQCHATPPLDCHRALQTDAECAELTETLAARLGVRRSLLTEWIASEPWDLFIAILVETHCAGHHCWHLHDPSHPQHDPASVARFGDPLERIYAMADAALGDLVERAGPDAVIIVFSLIGMGPDHTGDALLAEVLRRMEASDAGRRAFSLKHDAVSGAIRLNVAGREPAGVIAPGAEYDAEAARLTRVLLDLRDPHSGRPLIARVVRTDQEFPGPRQDWFADLLAVWNAEAPLLAAVSPQLGEVRASAAPYRTGNHQPGGWFVIAGPGIGHDQRAPQAEIIDLAPTAAACLGVGIEGLPGRSIL